MAHCAVHCRCICETLRTLQKVLNQNQYLNQPLTKNLDIPALQLPPALNLNKLGNVRIAQLLWHISFVSKI
jgi:hypothetical protein